MHRGGSLQSRWNSCLLEDSGTTGCHIMMTGNKIYRRFEGSQNLHLQKQAVKAELDRQKKHHQQHRCNNMYIKQQDAENSCD